jgi:hypothetical protein
MKVIRNSLGLPFVRLGKLHALLHAAALAVLLVPIARASDPNGIYAFVDRVVLEPNDTAPERIQVWGGFALAKRENPDAYQDAQRGYMYFKLRPGDEAVCRKEWADLKSVAGTRQIVAFGSRYEEPAPKVRSVDADVDKPDSHPKSIGINKVRMRDYSPLKQLEKLMEKTADAKESPTGKDASKPASK